METNSYLTELSEELQELQDELKVINKYLLEKKKLNNTLFKELMADKDEIEKQITEVEIEIEIVTRKKNTDVNTNNIIN
jgi:uncharacterized protein YdcH (DUF465 family)